MHLLVPNLICDQFCVYFTIFNIIIFSDLHENQFFESVNFTFQLLRFLSRFAIWLMLFTDLVMLFITFTLNFFTPNLGIMLFVSIMCNINYSLKTLNKLI